VSFCPVTALAARGLRRLAGAALLGAGLAEAQVGAVASASAVPPAAGLNIWYRSSEGCPEGAVFVARLAELGRQATLAHVGDRVDFVVTVASAPSGSSGRLERQTARGTVAIRQIEASRCDEVAEALALSLEIALEPENTAERSANAATPSSGVVDVGSDGPAPTPPARGAFEVGAQGSLARGIAPGWAPGGALFVQLRALDELPIAGRLSLVAAFASDTVRAIDVDVFWLAGRAEGCVFELRSGRLSLQPCLGAELGSVRAGSSGGASRTDADVWAAAAGHLRASLEIDERLALEAQVGAAVPVVRYAVGSSRGGDLFQTEPVILGLAIGGRWSP
jgi:hypothetical protein